MKLQPFSLYFIMADGNFPFLLTLGKVENQTLGEGVGNLEFCCRQFLVISRMHTHFHLFQINIILMIPNMY